jgi:hypothetical protein
MHSTFRKTAMGATTALLLAISVGQLSASASGTSKRLTYFEKNSSFSYTSPAGVVQQGPPEAAPQPGSQIEFSDLNYSGTHTHHARAWSASDHFVCVFSATGVPTCNGEIAVGSSMLIIKGTGGQGTFSIPIVSGTGSYLGYRGMLKVADIGQTANADLVVVVSK